MLPLFVQPIAFESLIKLSKILGTGVLIISHQSQSRCTSPASHLHKCGLLLLYSEEISADFRSTSRQAG